MGIVGAYMVPHPKELIPDIGRGKEWKYPRTIEAYRRIAQEIREIEPEDIRRSHTLLYMTAVLALVVFEVVKVLVCLWYFTVQV